MHQAPQSLMSSALPHAHTHSHIGAPHGRFRGEDKEPNTCFYHKDEVVMYIRPHFGISGRLAIVSDGETGDMKIEWFPYATQPPEALVYGFTIELVQVQSFRRYIPVYAVGNVTIMMESGIAYPPLAFIKGGVHEFLNAVKEHVPLKNHLDPDLFSVDLRALKVQQTLRDLNLEPPTRSPVQKKTVQERVTEAVGSFTTRLLKGYYGDGAAASPSSSPSVPTASQSGNSTNNSDAVAKSGNSGAPLLTSAEQALAIADFEILRPDKDDDVIIENQQQQQASLTVHVSAMQQKLSSEPNVTSVASQPPKKSLRGPGLSAAEWRNCFDSEGRISSAKEEFIRRLVYCGGMDDSIRSEVWRYLFGYFPFGSTADERTKIRQDKSLEYNLYKGQWKSLTREQLRHFAKFRDRKSRVEKDVVRTDRQFYYFEGDNSNPHLVVLHDILLTYAFFNFDLGYVQGMNDLLVPILVTLDDEVDSFWCFKGLMEKWKGNFHKDQQGMHAQLQQLAGVIRVTDPHLHKYLESADCVNMFFSYRWLLIQFKREFEFSDVLKLWDVFWSWPDGEFGVTDHFHIFFAAAALETIRERIIAEQMKFDDLVKFMNEMSGQMDVDALLLSAQKLYQRFMQLADDSTKRQLFPPPQLSKNNYS